MSKRYLILAFLFLLALSGLALARSACADNPSNQGRDEAAGKAERAPTHPLATPAGMRWLQGQPTHWRSLLLHRD